MPTTDKWSKFAAMTDGWIASSDDVHAFGRDMVEAGFIYDLDELLSYFEKPWHWESEHAWWVANGRPDSGEIWEQGDDSGFVINNE